MAEQEAQDVAAKNRIISHMNADHHDSIIRYLQHYHSFSSFTAATAKMTDISLHSMTFACAGQPYKISFNPPMTILREARERVVEMDRECLLALGKSDVTVAEFEPPTGLNLVLFVVCAASFLGYSQRWWFAQGQMVERVFGAGFAAFGWAIQPWTFWGMVLIHSAEMLYLMRPRLEKHSVNIRTGVYWKWMLRCCMEGYFSIMRFDQLVAKNRAAKEKQRH